MLSPSSLRQRAAAVLALFACAIALTLFAPFVQADAHAGHAQAAIDDEHDDCGETQPPPVDHTAHCPLCLPVAAPPAFALPAFASMPPLALATRGIPAARVVARVAAPLPARGPPLPA